MQAELLAIGALERSIEAVLFVASESLSIKALAKLTGAEESEVTVALQKIDSDCASRGIVLREIAGGYRFATAPSARAVVEAYLMPPKTNLSPAALETLAIVAYMQPITKGDIEGIRGVSADSVLSTLVDRRFLSEAGRKDVAGRPILYRTTPDFLEAFGLRSLEELPPIDVEAGAPVELAFPVGTVRVDGSNAGPGSAPVNGAAGVGVASLPAAAAPSVPPQAPADGPGESPAVDPGVNNSMSPASARAADAEDRGQEDAVADGRATHELNAPEESENVFLS